MREIWHVVTLILEILGFGLAYIHVFREQIANRARIGAFNFRDAYFSGFSLHGVDDDKTIPIEQRNAWAHGSSLVRVLQLVGYILCLIYFNSVTGLQWKVAKYFISLPIAFFGAILVYILLAYGVDKIIKLATLAGKGNLIAGIGFFLGAAGMFIETLQVWNSHLRIVVIVVCGFVLLFIITIILRRRQES